MALLEKNPKLASMLQETLVQLLDKQPGFPNFNPELLEAITAPKPVLLAEEIAENARVKKALALAFKLPSDTPPADPAEKLLPVDVEGDLGDVLSDLKLLERAGVGFGKEESMRIYLSIKKLIYQNPGVSEGEKITRARFWGKIIGTQKDYLIAECVIENRKELPPLPQDTDPKRMPPDPISSEHSEFIASSNQMVYYVASSAYESDWTRLQDVLPAQIIAARLMRRLFSGILDSSVNSRIPFPWREAELLRATIALITHDCRIAPRGHLADTTEEGGDLTVGLSEEGTFFGMTGQELCELHKSAWVHATLDLLPQGRSMYYNYGWTAPEDKPEAKDPGLEKNRPALQSIHLDLARDLGAPAWTAQVCGAQAPQYAAAVVRSNVWPGACAVGWGYTFVNIYVGTGLNSPGTMYAPSVAWPLAPERNLEEFKKGPRSRPDGVGGDLNLEPPRKPDDTPPPA